MFPVLHPRSVTRMPDSAVDQRNHHTGLDVYRFVFALGDALIRSGASSATTTKALLAVSEKAGLRDVTVSVTLGQLVISDQPAGQSAEAHNPRTRVHEVETGALDIRTRVRAEEVIEDFLVNDVGLEDALAKIEVASDRSPVRDWWRVASGYGILGAGFSMVLGGELPSALGAGVTSLLISMIFHWMGYVSAPGIFRLAVGGFVAVLAATGINVMFDLNEVAVCVVAAIAAWLAGIAAYGAVQDAVTGWYLAAAGRLMEVATNTAGLVAGVAAGIATVNAVWAPDLELIETLEPDTMRWTETLIGAALVSGGFALSSGACKLRLGALTAFGAAVQLMNLAVTYTGAGSFLTIALTAVTAGAVGVLVARPLNLSSNAIMMVSLLPLFPGMLVYQGLLGNPVRPRRRRRHLARGDGHRLLPVGRRRAGTVHRLGGHVGRPRTSVPTQQPRPDLQ